ncbi:MAG: hypothetical protein J6I68_15030 [Butyrivibrio sp.]|uniref:hypothetical protein n=1 Tax=Butyrivibrio sp. TaxID=28121 RepID=UPI001B758B76|nr:hypothetical protein [Butyrivibrio sp.]MBP3784557.1 hypothetical protein [Butyrivibrio sp.]
MSEGKKLSTRERLRQLNSAATHLSSETSDDETIIGVQLKNYTEHEEALEKEEKEPQKTYTENIPSPQPSVQDNKKGGRPRKYNEPMKWIKIQISETNYKYAKINGALYDGMNGYINHLLDEARKQ